MSRKMVESDVESVVKEATTPSPEEVRKATEEITKRFQEADRKNREEISKLKRDLVTERENNAKLQENNVKLQRSLEEEKSKKDRIARELEDAKKLSAELTDKLNKQKQQASSVAKQAEDSPSGSDYEQLLIQYGTEDEMRAYRQRLDKVVELSDEQEESEKSFTKLAAAAAKFFG